MYYCFDINYNDVFTEFKEAFKNFDKNGDGKISCKELRTFLKSVGQDASDAEVQRIMLRVDHDSMYK